MVVIRLALLTVALVVAIPLVVGSQDAGVFTGTPVERWFTASPVPYGTGWAGLLVWAAAGLAGATWVWSQGEHGRSGR